MPTLPLSSFSTEGEEFTPQVTTFADQFAVFGSLSIWLGMLIGIGFVAAAIYFRGVRNET